MTTKRCAYCGELFQTRPQVPDQTYCASKGCQRARKRKWQQAKLQSDAAYRANQRDAQRAWQERHPDYWRGYRETHPEYAERNRDRQRLKASPRTTSTIAKMDTSAPIDGIYQLRIIAAHAREIRNGWIVELVPICDQCPCKKDACK